jgi:putative tryptophan/tyrosine transport system substrate-binding protein
MRRRDFTIGLLLAAATQSSWAQEPAKQHRIAIIRAGGSTAHISDTSPYSFYKELFKELRRLGDIEGQNLTVERYSGEGQPEGFADLAREVVNRKPDLVLAISPPIAKAVRAASDTMPIVLAGGDPIRAGLATSLAHPGGNMTGVTTEVDPEIWGKRLQILKEALPSVSRVSYLDLRAYWQNDAAPLREPSQQLHISLVGMLLEESTPAELRRVFGEIPRDRPDAIMVGGDATLTGQHSLIVELVDKSRLPAMYPWREYVEAGGLMAYGADLGEGGRRTADDVHEILNGAKPGDIPIYRPTKFELVINLKAANALGLTIPPSVLARADEVIE